MAEDHSDNRTELEAARRRLETIEAERDRVLAEIRRLERFERNEHSQDLAVTTINHRSSSDAKVTVFRELFRGRQDVYPRRWESTKSGRSGYAFACSNEWRPGICRKPEIPCRDCDHREYLPLDANVVRAHLQGFDPKEARRTGGTRPDFTAGVYPLLPDETTWFLAADFDKGTWEVDAKAFLEACRAADVPAALERSRSGRGGHVWIFFSEPVPAARARRLGTQLLAAAMDARPEIGMDSYDRFFPSQDTMPKGGFGNLIALPLQKRPREEGNSVFVDDDLCPYSDQWAFLSTLPRLSLDETEARCSETARPRDNLFDDELEDDQPTLPWVGHPRGRGGPAEPIGDLPKRVVVTIANQLFVEKTGLPPRLRHRILRLATFGNPEFYRAQKMRFSTHDKPRFICCAEDFPSHVGLPRGCLDGLRKLLEKLGIELDLNDERILGDPLKVVFGGVLRPEQIRVVEALVAHDTGVLSAPTGFGKTVIAADLIARRGVETLVLVHRKELLEQWHAQLTSLFGLGPRAVGRIGGGRKKATGTLDVAMIQSLRNRDDLGDLLAGYGHLVIDECHHVSAQSFEAVTKTARSRYVTGLSATPVRKDGHHPIVFMQCGPIRHEVDARALAASRPFIHRVRVRPTEFRHPPPNDGEDLPIQEVFRHLVVDPGRNDQILDDVISAVDEGRCPVLLTERKEHVAFFEERLQNFVRNLFVLHGGLRPKARRETLARLRELPETEERLLVATGRYLGEGFDDPRLDTLFLVFPVSWRGTLKQYVGRLHRTRVGKEEVRVYDYLDAEVPVLARMYERRRRGYKALGYSIEHPEDRDQVGLPDRLPV